MKATSRVARRGKALGVVAAVLPEVTKYGKEMTSVLITARGSAEWYWSWGHRTDMLSDSFVGKQVCFDWVSYEGGSRRYFTGEVTSVGLSAAGRSERVGR